MSTRLAAALSLLSCLAIAPAALADVGPPDDMGCTVAEVQKEGTTCRDCRGSFQAPDQCSERFAGTNFKYTCKTSGSSVWTEVWCDGPPEEAEEEDEDDGCAFAGVPAAASGTFAAGVLIAAAAAWARRRRRPEG
jgi:MYXO-CTERM domain-containing protein